MIRFLAKILLFSILPLLTLYGVFLLENGKSEPFYLRFTSPEQNSLVLGTSKAAQGIIPTVINTELGKENLVNLYNYSFTINNSPYGPAYFESIKKKLKQEGENRVFIVTVDPWSLSSIKEDPNNPKLFIENKSFLNGLISVNSSPNIHYLLRWFESQYFEILLSRIATVHSILHEDGWYETGESKNFNGRLTFMENLYRESKEESEFSDLRFSYLKEIIEFLKTRGNVFLIRMPIHSNILNIENELDPDFDLKMTMLAKEKQIKYLNYSKEDNQFNFKDGIHLNKISANNFSKKLAEFLKNEVKF